MIESSLLDIYLRFARGPYSHEVITSLKSLGFEFSLTRYNLHAIFQHREVIHPGDLNLLLDLEVIPSALNRPYEPLIARYIALSQSRSVTPKGPTGLEPADQSFVARLLQIGYDFNGPEGHWDALKWSFLFRDKHELTVFLLNNGATFNPADDKWGSVLYTVFNKFSDNETLQVEKFNAIRQIGYDFRGLKKSELDSFIHILREVLAREIIEIVGWLDKKFPQKSSSVRSVTAINIVKYLN